MSRWLTMEKTLWYVLLRETRKMPLFLELQFCFPSAWAEKMDYPEHSTKPNVIPLLLVLVEDQSSHVVICSCGFMFICARTILLMVFSFSLSSIATEKIIWGSYGCVSESFISGGRIGKVILQNLGLRMENTKVWSVVVQKMAVRKWLYFPPP